MRLGVCVGLVCVFGCSVEPIGSHERHLPLPAALAVSDFLGATAESGVALGTTAVRLPHVSTVGTASAQTDLPSARQNGSLVATSGYLYSIGGETPAGKLADVLYTQINSDGSLGAWSPTTPLPVPTRGVDLIAANGRIYAMGGVIGSATQSFATTVQSAPVNADGTVGAWVTHTSTGFVGGENAPARFVWNNRLYLVNGNKVFQADLRADGSTGSWTSTSVSPAITAYACAAMVDGRIYILSGEYSTLLSIKVFWAPIAVDGSVGTFVETTSLPVAASSCGAAAVGGTLVVVGGNNVIGVLTGQTAAAGGVAAWQQHTVGSAQRNSHQVTTWNQHVYFSGGHLLSNSANLADVQLLTTAAPDLPIAGLGDFDAWTTPGSLPSARSGFTLTANEGFLYEVGGRSGVSTLGEAKKATINAATNGATIGAFSGSSTLATPRSHHAALALGGRLYVIGGLDAGGNRLASVEMAPINADGTLGAFTAGGALPAGRSDLAAVALAGKVYVLGGETATSTPSGDLLAASVNGDGTLGTFAVNSTFAPARSRFAAVAYRGRIYALGGADGGLAPLASVQVATPPATGTAFTWTAGTALATARYGHQAVGMNGYLLVMGGNGSSTSTLSGAVNDDGSIPGWADALPLASGKEEFAAAAWNGRVYLAGGKEPAEVQSMRAAAITAPAARGSLIRVLDFGAAVTSVDSLTVAGSAAAHGAVRVEYRAAPASGVFAAPVSLGEVAVGVPRGLTGLANTRWLSVRLTLDEQRDASPVLATGLRDVTSLAVAVTTGPPASLAFSSPPHPSVGAGACSAAVSAQLREAGGGPAPAITATVITLAGGTFYSDAGCTTGPITSVTVPAGSADAPPFYFVGTTLGTFTITISATGLGQATQDHGIVVGAPAKLGFTVQPTNVQVSTPMGAIKVAVQDLGGNTVTTSTASITLTVDQGAVPLTGSATGNAGSGVATFTGLQLGAAATGVKLRAASSGLTDAVSVPFVVSAIPPPTKLVFTTAARSVQINRCSDPLTVQAQTSAGAVASLQAALSVALAGTGANFFSDAACSVSSASLQLTSAGPNGTFYFKAGAAGTVTVTASSGGLTAASQDATVTLNGAAASKLAFTTVARAVQVQKCSDALTVQAQTATGAAADLGGSAIDVTLAGAGATFFNDAACSLGTTTLHFTNTPSGSFYFKADATGRVTVTASAAGLTSATQDETVTLLAPTDTAGEEKTLTGFACSSSRASGGAGAAWLLGLLALAALRRRKAGALLLLVLAAGSARAAEATKSLVVLELESKHLAPEDEKKFDASTRKALVNRVRSEAAKLLPNAIVMSTESMAVTIANNPAAEQMLCSDTGQCEINAGRAYQADYVVTPGLSRVAGRMRLALRLNDLRSTALVGSGEAEGESEVELVLGLATATRQALRALRPKEELEREEFFAKAEEAKKRLAAEASLTQAKTEKLNQEAGEKLATVKLIEADALLETAARRKAEASKRTEAAEDAERPRGASLIPDLIAGGVFDPKAKTLGVEVLLAGRVGPFQLRAGVDIAPHLGGRAALLYDYAAGPLELLFGPRLLVVPLTSGVAWGGGVQAEAALHLFSLFSLRTGVALEAYKAPTQTVLAPLLTFGLSARL